MSTHVASNGARKSETLRLGLKAAVFSPAAVNPSDFLGFELHKASSLQLWIGGVIDREHRCLSERHPKRAMALIEMPFTDLMTMGRGLWDALPAPPTYEWMLEQILPGSLSSPADANGLIFVSIDICPQVEDEFNEWNDTEHIPLLLQVPGVLCAQRYRALTGAPKYLALYYVSKPEVYADPAWLSANETPWTYRLRRFRLSVLHWIFQPWHQE